MTLDGEVLDSEVVLPVVGERLVEGTVLLLGDVGGVTSPERLGLVELLVLDSLLLDLLGLLLLLLILVDFLDLGLVLLIGLSLDFVILDLLLDLLGDGELDRVGDELGVLLHDILDLLLLKVLELVLLEVETDFGTATEGRVDCVSGDGESATSGGLPDVLLIVIVLGDNLHTLGDKVGRVETDTKLANHATKYWSKREVEQSKGENSRNISSRVESLHEGLGARLGDSTKVVDEVSLGHANTRVTESEDFVLLVGNDADEELLLGVEDGGVGEGGITDFVEGIRGVGDEFTKENLLVGVEGVWAVG